MFDSHIHRKHAGKYAPVGCLHMRSSPDARLHPASSISLSSPHPVPYHVLMALHVHLKVPYVTLPVGCFPFLGFSRQHVNIKPTVVLHAVVSRVHGVRQGAPGVWFPGFLSATDQAQVNLQASRDAALQDTHAVLHSGHHLINGLSRTEHRLQGQTDKYTRTLLGLEN